MHHLRACVSVEQLPAPSPAAPAAASDVATARAAAPAAPAAVDAPPDPAGAVGDVSQPAAAYCAWDLLAGVQQQQA